MLECTFIGHQGWVLRSETTTILLDPLLTSRFGHGGHLGEVFPPRALDLGAFPPIDAVVLSHEHDDHFDIPSLHLLDRRTPILLSARASVAAFGALEAMGFEVSRLEPGTDTWIGDLRVRTFAADHRGTPQADEWDALPMIVNAPTGHAFASSIDVRPPSRMLAALGELPRPGLWAHANNTTASTAADLASPRNAVEDDVEILGRLVASRHRSITEDWDAAVFAIVGGGWSFPAPRQALNHIAFPVASERLADALRGHLDPELGSTICAAVPGDTFRLWDGAGPQRSRAAFVDVPERAQWPDREWNPSAGTTELYAAATGSGAIDEADWRRLESGLDEFARYVVGTELFRGLHSLSRITAGGRSPELALRLRHRDGARVLRHDASACRFVPADDAVQDPVEHYVCGVEAWAVDVLALLEGSLGASGLCQAGRMRVWNHHPSMARVSPHLFWLFAHPLRRPDVAARLYRQLIAELPPSEARLRWARSTSA